MRLLLDNTGHAGPTPYEELRFDGRETDSDVRLGRETGRIIESGDATGLPTESRMGTGLTPASRPNVIVNMVSPLDGRTVNDGNARGLGSERDRELMHRIRRQVNAALIGASTLRADPKSRYPEGVLRCVISASGNLPVESSFFTEDPENVVVFGSGLGLPEGVTVVEADLPAALKWLRQERGVQTLLVEGGAHLNGQLFREGLVDELFLTLAPKLRGGDGPTIVATEPFDPAHLPRMQLMTVYEEEGELFLRYRTG